VNPALHVQAAMTELDAAELEFVGHVKHTDDVLAPTVVEYVPTPQSVHAALPLVVLYLPATQVEHTPPSGPVNPALHVQATMTELDAPEFVFAGHAKHTPDVVAPTVAE
jgi:hypothetical protein